MEDDLIEHFKKYGEISFVTIKKDSTTGRSRCFGFIDFVDSDGMHIFALLCFYLLFSYG